LNQEIINKRIIQYVSMTAITQLVVVVIVIIDLQMMIYFLFVNYGLLVATSLLIWLLWREQ
jgi:hypothetical protein